MVPDRVSIWPYNLYINEFSAHNFCQKLNWTLKPISFNGKMKDFRCVECSYVTNKKFNLQKHMKVHEKVMNPDVIPKCSECDKSFCSKK